jgi:hypothetical protein
MRFLPEVIAIAPRGRGASSASNAGSRDTIHLGLAY